MGCDNLLYNRASSTYKMGWDTMPCSRKKERTLGLSELDIVLSTNMGIFEWLASKEIKFNPRPFVQKEPHQFHNVNNIEFYTDMIKKIDALIEENEKEAVFEVVDTEPPTKPTTMGKLAEIRNPLQKRPERPSTSLDVLAPPVFDKLSAESELFDIDLPNTVHTDFKIVASIEDMHDLPFKKTIENAGKAKDFHTWMLGIDEKQAQKVAMSFGKIKVRKKEERGKQNTTKNTEKTKERETSRRVSTVKKTHHHRNINGVSEKRNELAKTKRQIDEKKKALKKAKEQEKSKAKELKQQMIEKERKAKQDEKRKKAEQKKAQKEAKQKEREQKKRQKVLAKQKRLEQQRREEKLNKKIVAKKKKTPKQSAPKTHHLLHTKKDVSDESPMVDEDIIKVLTITDNLLEKLPNDVVDEFVQSKDFELYEKVISKYKIK